MTTIYYESDASPAALLGQSVGVVGYGNQGRCWARNLRDSGYDVSVHVRRDETRAQAEADGFAAREIDAVADVDVVCVLVPDDVIPSLALDRGDDALTIVASGYALAFDRFAPSGDLAMIAPRMLGPEVRRCYEEGVGFITALGVQTDVTGTALARTLAIALAIGGLKQGAIEMTPHQEAVLDLAVEQVLSPALSYVNESFVRVMSEHGIPFEAILCELFYSGEIERNFRLMREVGFAGQLQYHSPASQYGQLSRRGRYNHLDIVPTMREITDGIASGAFADEWDAEAAQGMPTLAALKQRHAGEVVQSVFDDLRASLGPGAGR